MLPLLLFGAGVLQGLALAWPSTGEPLWLLGIISLSVLAWALLQTLTWRHATALSFAFSFGFMGSAVWWLFISLNTYGAIPAPLAALAVCLFCVFLALQYTASMLLAYGASKQASRRAGKLPRAAHGSTGTLFAFALVFASALTLAELTRATLFTGFPWGSVGYSQIDGPLARFAPWAGVYGVGWLTALVAALLGGCFFAWQQTRSRWFGGGILGLCLVSAVTLAVPHDATQNAIQSTTATSIALLQGNIAQSEKFQEHSGVTDALQWYTDALWQSTASLTIAPETAIPVPQTRLSENDWAALEQHLVQQGRAAIVGIPYALHMLPEAGASSATRPHYRYSNAALALGTAALRASAQKGLTPGFDWDNLWRYDKHHLVPFGEWIPPLFEWLAETMQIPFSDFVAEPAAAPGLDWNGNRFAITVCYEDLFGEELAIRFLDPSNAPTVLVNISNLAWFDSPTIHSTAMDQHLQIARMRSLEFARPSVRATNTGATTIIDAQGHVRTLLPYAERGILLGQVEGMQGNTGYATWASRFGLWPLWIGAALLLCLGTWWLRLIHLKTAQCRTVLSASCKAV